MLLTILPLEEMAAKLDGDLATLAQTNGHYPLETRQGILAGTAQKAAHAAVAEICRPANWPREYRQPLLEGVALELHHATARHGVSTKQLLDHLKPELLVRPIDLEHGIGEPELSALRNFVGEKGAARILNRIQHTCIEATYGMARRGQSFNPMDVEGNKIQCPKVGDAVLCGLDLGDPARVPPAMKAIAETLLLVNQAQRGVGKFPDLADFKDRLRHFFTTHAVDCLPHAIRNNEHAGHLLFTDHEPHLPPVTPEQWNAARPAIRHVAGEKRYQEAIVEIIQVALERVSNSVLGVGLPEKVRTALGDDMPEDLWATLVKPSSEAIERAKERWNLPSGIDAAAPTINGYSEDEERLFGEWLRTQTTESSLRGGHRDSLHPRSPSVPPGDTDRPPGGRSL
jgi:hypothetical protein